MRITAFVFAWLLSMSGPAAAQDWDLYTSIQDGFTVNFPGQPKVTEATWTSQLNYILPVRVYSAEKGRERYSLTVVDYRSIEQQGIERAKTCPPGNANCRANAPAALGPGYARHDERGAIVYATFTFLQRDAKLKTIYSNSYHGLGLYPVPASDGAGRGGGAGAEAPAGGNR